MIFFETQTRIGVDLGGGLVRRPSKAKKLKGVQIFYFFLYIYIEKEKKKVSN